MKMLSAFVMKPKYVKVNPSLYHSGVTDRWRSSPPFIKSEWGWNQPCHFLLDWGTNGSLAAPLARDIIIGLAEADGSVDMLQEGIF